ncbi:hypothetical protein B0T21DRAFT_396119 [Apiosordaria backusii]|uniref:Uncharacterized protein n=1 Tax=Apiosordaria backusii TaxID=314023 RepID=A0AA40AIQ0_9PEZI|nr:hypothetical protein B0T21DRAFT_396119 [Apiosordaria backusii]
MSSNAPQPKAALPFRPAKRSAASSSSSTVNRARVFQFWDPNGRFKSDHVVFRPMPGKDAPDNKDAHGSRDDVGKDEPRKNAYLTHFGALTGDKWHVAAAHILSKYDKNTKSLSSSSSTQYPAGNFTIKACLTVKARLTEPTPASTCTVSRIKPKNSGLDVIKIPKTNIGQDASRNRSKKIRTASSSRVISRQKPSVVTAQATTTPTPSSSCPSPVLVQCIPKDAKGKRIESDSVRNGRNTWNSYNTIGLDTVLMPVDTKNNHDKITAPHTNLSSPLIDRAYRKQRTHSVDQQTFDTIPLIFGHSETTQAVGPTGVNADPRVISLHCSTSIVMQMIDQLGKATSQKILGYRLSGGGRPTFERTKRLAEEKVETLCQKITKIKESL